MTSSSPCYDVTCCRLLDLTLEGAVIRHQDARSVLEAVSDNPSGRDLAWDFLKQHFDELPN